MTSWSSVRGFKFDDVQFCYLVSASCRQEACELPFRFRLFRFQPSGHFSYRHRGNLAGHAARKSCLDLLRLVDQPALQDRDAGRTVAERFLAMQRGGEREPVLLQRL